jgi:hypothetical protein
MPFVTRPFSFAPLAPAAILLIPSCAALQQTKGVDASTTTVPTSTLAIPHDVGTVWFPVQWNITIPANSDETGKEPLSSLKFASPGLILRDNASKTEHLIPFASEGENGRDVTQKEIEVNGGNRTATLRLPHFFSLPAGVYTIEGVGGMLPVTEGQSGKARRTTVPFKNLFDTNPNAKMEIEVKKGMVGLLPRLRIETRFFRQNQALIHLSKFESLDKDHLAGETILAQLGSEKSPEQKVYAASQDFPKLRLPLSSTRQAVHELPFGRVAIATVAPCNLKGRYTFVWKRSGDPIEYIDSVALGEGQRKCTLEERNFSIVAFPRGKWTLIATSFSPDREEAREKDNLLNISFDFSTDRKVNGDGAYTARSEEIANSVLYAGAVKLSIPTESKEKGRTIDSIWEPRFNLEEIKDAAHATKVFDAYRLLPITKDQTKETVRTVIRTLASDTEGIAKFRGELQKKAREIFSSCVVDRHQIDPLLIVSGSLSFKVLKWTNYADFSRPSIEGDETSAAWFAECLERRFRSFRFSERIPEPFQGSLSFQLE